MSEHQIILQYRSSLGASIPPLLLPRRFIVSESWTKAATEGGTRYLGFLRDYEPDLPAVLAHPRVVILGEPGAGKSMTAYAVVQRVLKAGQSMELPVLASLKGYDGNLRALLLRSIPPEVLDSPRLIRSYILDGIDEIPTAHRGALVADLKGLLAKDGAAKLVLTARQAFYAHHPDAFPDSLVAYHLLDFDDSDIEALARHYEVNPATFLATVQSVDCEEEIHNPFVLTVMLQRFKERDSLSPLRSDNVGFVIDRLIHSRPLINAVRQRRALRMLAITCETAARNELTDDEARTVLLEAIELSPATAEQLLDELSHSILIRTPGRISFQMRSYGEYLAAEELSDKSLDRLRELAFVDNRPLDTWLNSVTYLAEMNDKVRQYFANRYPTWLINVSPAAFTEAERATLTKTVVNDINQKDAYIVDYRDLSWRRLARLLTPDAISELQAQLQNGRPHEVANALVLLGILRQVSIVPAALRLATDHRDASTLRYSAIIALINGDDSSVVDDLIAFAHPGDTYYLQVVDAIGSLCTPADFARVLPLVEGTNAGLSAAHYHFREFKTKEALQAALDYLTTHPNTLNGFGLDAYLEPVMDLLPEHWDSAIGASVGLLLASLERMHFHDGRLAERIVRHVASSDRDAITLRAAILSLQRDGIRLQWIHRLVVPLITETAAQWIVTHAPEYRDDLAVWLPDGVTREILSPTTPQFRQAQEQARLRSAVEQKRREEEITSTREEHQSTIRTSRNINAVVDAAARLPKEHWPPINPDQSEWLTTTVNDALELLDLANSIKWISENQWTHPRNLNPLLRLIDYYDLTLVNDVPIILALRSWSDTEITNYCRRNGLTPAGQAALANLLNSTENDNIVRHALVFLRESGSTTPEIAEIVARIAQNPARPAELRIQAIDLLDSSETAANLLVTLATDHDAGVRSRAFRQSIKRQDRATIQQALATLKDNELATGDVPISQSSPLDWIGDIKSEFALPNLRTLRLRTLKLSFWRVSLLVTGTIANIDKIRAATVIREQLHETPSQWQPYFRNEADKLERAARIDAVHGTPFEEVIKKLKGATSMIRLKVWCEGPNDRPVFRQLFREMGEDEIADTLDYVGGWPNLITEQEPERWLDGCRQAVIVMDGDAGRKLNKTNQPLTDQAKSVEKRFRKYPLKLYVLKRYGIENYLPRAAYETVLGRDLNAYFPIPLAKRIEDHFVERKSLWRRLLNFLQRKRSPSFYQKRLNEQVAQHLTLGDIENTDLAAIVQDVKRQIEEARRY